MSDNDNFHFDLTDVPMGLCLQVAFGRYRKAIGWSEEPLTPGVGPDATPSGVWGARQATKRLVLFWADHPTMTRFPAQMNATQAEPFILAWLGEAAYGREPDHDGDNSKGFRIYNEDWGHAAGHWEAFMSVEPIWLLHGK